MSQHWQLFGLQIRIRVSPYSGINRWQTWFELYKNRTKRAHWNSKSVHNQREKTHFVDSHWIPRSAGNRKVILSEKTRHLSYQKKKTKTNSRAHRNRQSPKRNTVFQASFFWGFLLISGRVFSPFTQTNSFCQVTPTWSCLWTKAPRRTRETLGLSCRRI